MSRLGYHAKDIRFYLVGSGEPVKGVNLGVTCSRLYLSQLFLEWGGRMEGLTGRQRPVRGCCSKPGREGGREGRHNKETKGRSSLRDTKKTSQDLAEAPNAKG